MTDISIPAFLEESSDSEHENGNVLKDDIKKQLKKIAKKAKEITTPKKDETKTKKQLSKERNLQRQSRRSVICVRRLPFGFFETQLREFFEQFGDITRLRLCRSKRGRSRHMAFIEFADNEVGPIASKAMDGYILDLKTLRVDDVPAERVKLTTFKGWSRHGKKTDSWEDQITKDEQKKTNNNDENNTDDKNKTSETKRNKKRKRTEQKLARRKRLRQSLNIDYKFTVCTNSTTPLNLETTSTIRKDETEEKQQQES